MATMRDIRRRIRVVKNIQQITNAMKMVAAARLKRAQDKAEATRPYAEKMEEALRSLSVAARQVHHPLLEVRTEESIAIVVVGADRGMAGAYNSNIMRKAMELARTRPVENVKLVLAGKKAAAFFRRQPYEVVATLDVPASNVTFSDVRDITVTLRGLFEEKQVDAVYLVYAQFVTAMTQKPTVQKILPIEPAENLEAETLPTDYIFEPEPEKLFADLLPRYVETEVYRALVEAVASEHGARMTAMSAATSNADEMIDNLTLALNKARQAAITKELTEIVGGAEALR